MIIKKKYGIKKRQKQNFCLKFCLDASQWQCSPAFCDTLLVCRETLGGAASGPRGSDWDGMLLDPSQKPRLFIAKGGV